MNPEQKASAKSELGCFILLWVLAAGAAVGGFFAWKHDVVPLAVIAFAAALFLAWLGRPGKKPSPAPVTVPVPDSGAEMFRILERLGIPPAAEPSTPQDALVGGAAKAGISRGCTSIEGGRWDEAIARLSPSIDLLGRQQDAARWSKILSVAHRLRAQAHEGAGRRPEARADYERALALAPGDAEAEAGKTRTS